jgi:hypothetical protein
MVQEFALVDLIEFELEKYPYLIDLPGNEEYKSAKKHSTNQSNIKLKLTLVSSISE